MTTYTLKDVERAEERLREELPEAIVERTDYGLTLSVAHVPAGQGWWVYRCPKEEGVAPFIGDIDEIIRQFRALSAEQDNRAEYLIQKNGYFYRPNRAGYTREKAAAGRYTKAEAEREAAIEPENFVIFHESEVEDAPQVMDLKAALASANERAEKAEGPRWADTYIDDLNALCAELGCPAGSNRLDWLRAQLSTLKARVVGLEGALKEIDRMTYGADGDLRKMIRARIHAASRRSHMDRDDIDALIERVRGLEGPDREVDAAVARQFDLPRCVEPDCLPAVFERILERMDRGEDDNEVSSYTASLDAVVSLIERELPGWAWKVGTCSVSDDAWLVPDFNSPEHGERLKRELSYDTMKRGDLWDEGIDIDQRPAGRPALALLLAFLTAVKEKQNG